LKALIIEDSKIVCDAIVAVLNKGDTRTVSVGTIEGALAEYKGSKYDVVILDMAVDGHRGLDFIDAITPAQDSTNKERKRMFAGAPVVVIRHVGEKVPTDCMAVKQEIPFPFTGEELANAIHDSLSSRQADKIRASLIPPKVAFDSIADLEKKGISAGNYYIFDERKPTGIRKAAGAFSDAGYKMFVVTSSRPKVAKERMGLERGADVFVLTGSELPLGSMVQAVKDFIISNPDAVIVLDDLDSVINRCGLDRTFRVLVAILRDKAQDSRFTFLTSVNGKLFGDSVKGMFSEIMTVFETEV